jgi:hypothetical protein
MLWVEYVARMEDVKNSYNILAGRREGKIPLGRSRRRCEDTIRMNLKEIGWECVGWIHLTQVRDQWPALVTKLMKLLVPCKAGNLLTSCVTISFSRRALFRIIN